jgi:hypothetical protein
MNKKGSRIEVYAHATDNSAFKSGFDVITKGARREQK